MKTYTHHLLFCAGDDCAGKELCKEAKNLLGKASVSVKRSKVACLGACKFGPVLIIYPDGIWYRCQNAKVLRQIVEEHILGGVPVEKQIIYQMPAPIMPPHF